ncbi:uncharacterized protein LOC143353864 [Halictus rubicundus]|uniref:uncharacterized protein LOC143353864 n=1 Tax=Halictus rubicundus TaxID=77578 RepID=UPI004035465E
MEFCFILRRGHEKCIKKFKRLCRHVYKAVKCTSIIEKPRILQRNHVWKNEVCRRCTFSAIDVIVVFHALGSGSSRWSLDHSTIRSSSWLSITMQATIFHVRDRREAQRLTPRIG